MREWPQAPTIETARLTLEPLRVEHAGELAPLLDDPRLHAYTGGRPLTLAELSARYQRLVAGRSPDGGQGWMNWLVRQRGAAPVGTLQATLHVDAGLMTADLAWVVAVAHQRRGFATEAATAVMEWLQRAGVERFAANIHPENVPSASVARRLRLGPTRETVDGELRWLR